jgi:hypothetical protein
MGLFGALVVRPANAPGQAYGRTDTSYDDEVLLVLSEVDPALNGRSPPSAFDLRNFAPKYFLINGKAHPAPEAIMVPAGQRLLLRYVNAGMEPRSMALLGSSQVVLATGGNLRLHPFAVVADSIPPGQSADALVTIPAATPSGTRFPLYDGGLSLHNNRSDPALGLGGMLTYIETSAGGAGSPGAPVTSGLLVSPTSTNGSVPLTVTAAVAAGGAGVTIAAAEYRVDAGGPAYPMAASDGQFDSAGEAVTGTITTATLATLAPGDHTVFVRGRDSSGAWGAAASAGFHLDDAQGPASSGLTVTPNPAGATAVAVHATGDDRATGGANVVAGEYAVDGTCPTLPAPCAMSIGAPSSVVSLDATIPAATVAILAEGPRQVSVRARDALGNWGGWATPVPLVVDRAGPVVSTAPVAAPNPNYGTLPLSAGNPVVRVTAGFTDAASPIAAAEGFLDTLGVAGTGFPLLPTDGSFNATTEAAFGDIPLTTVRQLSPGGHPVYVRARDASGNWGAAASTILTIIPDAIFADGFESGVLPGAWTSRSTTTASRLSVTTTAALVGTYGLQALGNNTNYVQYDFGTAANPASRTFDARFSFQPNATPSSGKDILVAATDGTFGTPTFRVRFRRSNGQPQVQIQVGAATGNATWTNVNASSSNVVEVVWRAAGSGVAGAGSLDLRVNGVLAQTLPTSSTNPVGAFRLGSVTTGAGTNGSSRMYFDAFAAKRSPTPLLGP